MTEEGHPKVGLWPPHFHTHTCIHAYLYIYEHHMSEPELKVLLSLVVLHPDWQHSICHLSSYKAWSDCPENRPLDREVPTVCCLVFGI